MLVVLLVGPEADQKHNERNIGGYGQGRGNDIAVSDRGVPEQQATWRVSAVQPNTASVLS